MASGGFTSRADGGVLERIREIDPKLSSVLEVNPDALAIADALDAERKAKGPRGPCTAPDPDQGQHRDADKMQTTAARSLSLV